MAYAVLALALVAAIQAAAVVALLVQRSRRARAERALRESEERLRLVLDRSPAMLWTIQPDTTPTLDYINQTCAEFTGLPLPKLREEGWLDVVHPADLDDLVGAYARAFEARTAFLLEYRLRRADGVYRWLLAMGVPKHGRDGSFAGYVGCDIDITERRDAEDGIREGRAALEVSHREIQDLAGRLIESQDAERTRIARDLHDDVSQQLAGVSIALSSLKHRMKESQVSEELKADLRALHQRTATLARNVRHLSHDLHPTVLRHGGLVAALTSHCAELERSHGTLLGCSAEGDFTSIDPGVALCLYRVAQEALRNVVAHSGASRADVRLVISDDRAEMEIADDGGGFDVARSLEQGTGLGLVSIRERVRLAGGTVTFEATRGTGTRVRVRLPARAAADSDAGSGVKVRQREVSLS
jgi:PAS domain S-box-containing protein